ncbi:ring canal kelch homolog [Myzus persicae]|uniref:ring canal kelch homolog n=1 Tax=Myzus persicae TaxID=13164 RepID=UPI000B9399ED|nr:ring canal kelch homolog [Myzus persicae]XP_022164430.1 ring canal kelch homolog [Myzus persicae]
MDSLCKSDQMEVMNSDVNATTFYENKSHTVKVFEVLQSLRKDKFLCDIKLETDDGGVVCGHKVVLLSASNYFRAMFTSFGERYEDAVKIRYLDSYILQLLVDYIYTGKIMVSKKNVQVLLPAANLLQLDYVKDACVEFLKTQLDPTNCFSIRAFAELHNCSELVSSSEAYVQKQFVDVVKGDAFLSLSSKEVIKLISNNVLNAPEEKVYDCVIKWVKHRLDMRRGNLPKLMEHVRLPLVSIGYISKKVVKEPLLKKSPKCKKFVTEALYFHSLKAQQIISIPQTIQNTPRKSGQKVILVFSDLLETHWYDPTTNLWQTSQKFSLMDYDDCVDKLTVIKDYFVFIRGSTKSDAYVAIFNLSLKPPKLVVLENMAVYRIEFGFGVLDGCIYIVGGCGFQGHLDSSEVFDIHDEKWRTIAEMSTQRANLGVGVLNNLIYAVGGCSEDDDSTMMKSVECYDPSYDTWTEVEEMSVCRFNVGVGVMDGVMYAVGGENENGCLKSVEAYKPSSGWSSIADMHFPRMGSSVFPLDGLLYVVGGRDGQSEKQLDSIEIYNPNINTWSLEKMSEKMSKDIIDIVGGVIVDKELVTKFNN